jgi:hypothetical protein
MNKMVLVLLVSVVFAQAQTVFIASNNKAANDIRKQLSKDSQKGKSCLTPTDDPSKAELRMDVNQGAPGSGFGTLPSISVSVTNKAGVVVFSGDTELAWERVYRRFQQKLCK